MLNVENHRMAKGVTLEQFNEWIKKNEKHTWSHNRALEGSAVTRLIKYFTIGFDTRTMDIFRISCSGFCDDFTVHTSDDIDYSSNQRNDDKTILDLLDEKILEELRERH